MIAGGGTGGHLFPGIALAREFRRRRPDARVLFVGTARGLESRIVPAEGFDLRLIPVSGWVGLGPLRKLRTLLELPSGFFRSFEILREVRPDLVVGVGGYASGPVMALAGLFRIPRVLVEPNAVPGLTNRILARWVDRIYAAFGENRTGFAAAARRGALRNFGNPVRRDILEIRETPSPAAERKTVLVMGGSQGSHAVNQALAGALAGLESMKSKLKIIHQSGEQDAAHLREQYDRLGFDAVVTPFLSPVAEALRQADLVVGRSGATTVAELTACGRPAILIPFAQATHGHQEMNARAMVAAGAAEMILEKDLNGDRLADRLRSLLSDPARLRRMADSSRRMGRPDAAERIVEDCLKLVGRG